MTDNDHVGTLEPPNETVPVPKYPPLMEHWLALCAEYPYMKLLAECPMNETHPPKACTRDQLAPLVGSLFNETHRAIIREILFELLADWIEKMVLVVLERETQ
jgi:hypothetical protein